MVGNGRPHLYQPIIRPGGGRHVTEGMVLFVARAALWVESGLPAPGAAAGGKAMVGNGRPGGSGHPYLNSEVDARGHGGRRVELEYGNFVVTFVF